ncbi:hypothetical protein C0992_002165 [Termitomyces sp. T32_za158]|nr:hypothetical protein C0992_002165 [Termitomyces sp. T32_za158]
MPKLRGTGISRVVNVRNLTGASRARKSYGLLAQQREREAAQERYEQSIRGLGTQSLQVLAEIQGSASMTADNNDISDAWEDVPSPPDDLVTHTAHDIIDSRFHSRYQIDSRTWRQRLQRLQRNWEPLIEDLVDAYLGWKYPVADMTTDPCNNPDYNYPIDVVDIFTLDTQIIIHQTESTKSISVALVQQGYLGTTPERPSLAVSLRTLELYYWIRRRKPSFSIEAFAKVLCDLYMIPYHRRYRDGLSNTFDVYLAILRIIDKRVAKELGRDAENWRVLNACPPCCNVLDDEPSLRFSRMFVLDGNNSLKRVGLPGDRQVGDLRTFEDSDYYLSTEFVNSFANEVKKQKPQPKSSDVMATAQQKSQPDNTDIDGAAKQLSVTVIDTIDEPNPESSDAEQLSEDDSTPTAPGDDAGDPTDGARANAPCTKNWKAAAAESNKKMWAIFDESGVFASACRHGFILWIIDMIQSGELAKYPLAIIAKALELLPAGFLTAYDIGCSFDGTIDRSSLGPLFKERRCTCCVNAFHGYSHNFLCQVQYHPSIIKGMGLEDLETLERVFSSSNQLAPVTRYMSKHRRRVFIDLFFRQWDEEKYENLGTMLLNNYTQALRIINDDGPEFTRAKQEFNVQEGDLEKWRLDEKEYFSTLGKEPEGHLLKIAYVERLRELREAEETYKSANRRFLISTPNDAATETYASELSSTRKRETERRHADERRDQLTRDVILLEEKLGITRDKRWSFASPEFLEISKYLSKRTYEKAVDKLQKLVIQRLFELQKLNLSYTAYKMRTHIAKSLQTRCQAIRTAVAAYNKAALALNPPKPTLDWSKVSHYTFLEDFAIIRDTNRDISDRPWAKVVIRELIKKDQKLQRAHEEIVRCNVEVRRLHTSIVDEGRHFTKRLQEIKEAGLPIYGAVDEFVTRRRRVNAQLLTRILQIYSLPGFTGIPRPGVKKDTMQVDGQSQTDEVLESGSNSSSQRRFDDVVPEVEEDDDEEVEAINGIVNFLGDLSISK